MSPNSCSTPVRPWKFIDGGCFMINHYHLTRVMGGSELAVGCIPPYKKKKQSYQSWSSTQLGGQQKLKPYISWNKRMQILSVDPHLPASPSRYPAKSLWPALSWIISLQWSKLTRNKLIWVWVTNGGRQWAHQNDHLEMQIVNHPLLSSIYDLAHTGPITIYSKYHIIYI